MSGFDIRWRQGLIWFLLGVGALLALSEVTTWLANGQRGALRALPSVERTGLYQRTLENLRAVCGSSPPSGLESFCKDQAQLALDFDDCDETCRELAHAHRPRPTR